jgi:hypothetical protein
MIRKCMINNIAEEQKKSFVSWLQKRVNEGKCPMCQVPIIFDAQSNSSLTEKKLFLHSGELIGEDIRTSMLVDISCYLIHKS